MDFNLFGQGWVLGLAISAPVGPIGILCIKRTLTQGWQLGLASGLGAATADGLYGCIAGFGLVTVSQVLVEQQFWLRLVGGVFLFYLGIRALAEALSSPTEPAMDDALKTRQAFTPHFLTAYGSTLALTLTNPVTILSFAAMFAGVGIAATNWRGASLLVGGVFTGSACWWLLLCSLTHRLHNRMGNSGGSLLRNRPLRWVNGLSALILIAFALAAITSLWT